MSSVTLLFSPGGGDPPFAHVGLQIADMKISRLNEFLAVSAFALLLAGCGGTGSPFPSVPVSGKVTYEDGSLIPVQGMKIYFHCLEPPKNGMHPRPATVGVGADGMFKDVTTYKYADGLVLGKHKVTLFWLENGKVKTKIAKQYADPSKTPLVVEVTDWGQFLDIKVPKPKGPRPQ